MPAKILFRDAQGRDGVVELHGEPIWIGRAMECAIRTDDAMVSRKHSMIRFEGGRYVVEDLGSSNGTHVNDAKVQRQALNHNDVVRCGSLWLRYVEDGGAFAGGPTAAGSGAGARTSMAGQAPPELGYASTVATPARSGGTMAGARPSSVVVDMNDSYGGGSDRYRAQADDYRNQFEMVRAERDKEVAENKRLRAENSNLQQRIDDQRTQQKEAEEVIQAHKRVAEELRSDMEMLKERDGRVTGQLSELQDDLASRTRQLQRANDDIGKMKSEVESAKRQVAELSRMKDEGFRRMNEQLAEVEHLREVIREQERMLEERRVGIISLEEAVKDLRNDREGRIKELAQLKGERDELRIGFNRQVATLQSTEEENRRLGRLMQDIQDGSQDRAEVMRLSRALKDSQFEAESQAAEVTRLTDMLKVAEQKAERLQAEVTKHEETPPADEARIRKAVDEMRKAEDARGKAEQLRVKAEQERNQALHEKEDIEFELDKLRRRVSELEAGGGGAAKSGPDPGTERKISDLQAKLDEAEARAADAKRKYAEVQAQLQKLEENNDELARKVKAAQTEADSRARGGGPAGALRAKAMEVYNNVNDVLAELRVNINVVRDEFGAMAGKNSDSRSRTIRDAIDAAAGQTEDVKGVLRSLRELTEE